MTMPRRAFLKKSGLLGAAALSPNMLSANAGLASTDAQIRTSPGQMAFRSSFNSIRDYIGPTDIKFDKPLPEAVSGTLYRNGPARLKRGATEYHHWFDGDGMIQSFQMHGQKLVHHAQMVRTNRFRAEEEAGRFLWPGFGTKFDGGLSVTQADDVNVANTSVLAVGDELWALWEAGSAWHVDPHSLETVERKVFSPETDGLPFSAHPKVDIDGRIWNFGYVSGADTLVIYDIAANGRLNRVKPLSAPNTNMVHDFAITENYLVFLLMPFTYNGDQDGGPVAFADRIGWDDNAAANVVVINKSSLEIEHHLQMPAIFAFHFGNAWQDGMQIRVEVAAGNEWDEFNDAVFNATKGQPLHQPEQRKADDPAAVELVIDLQRRQISTETIPIVGGDFPNFDERFLGLPTNTLTMINSSATQSKQVFGANQLVRFNRDTGKTQQFDYGSNTIAEEHVFVANPGGAEGDGWLLGTSYNWRDQITSLSVFNAMAIADGPIATARLPYALPLGFHGKFVAS